MPILKHHKTWLDDHWLLLLFCFTVANLGGSLFLGDIPVKYVNRMKGEWFKLLIAFSIFFMLSRQVIAAIVLGLSAYILIKAIVYLTPVEPEPEKKEPDSVAEKPVGDGVFIDGFNSLDSTQMMSPSIPLIRKLVVPVN